MVMSAATEPAVIAHLEQRLGATVHGVPGLREAAHLSGAHGQRAALAKQPFGAHARQAERAAHLIVERHLFAQLDDHARLVVVLQVGANLGRIHLHGNNKGPDEIAAALEAGVGAVDMMRAIKRALDPQNILNPGKIFAL